MIRRTQDRAIRIINPARSWVGFENYNRYADKPCTKITSCLQEVFGLPYDQNLGRYSIRLGAAARLKARDYLLSIGCQDKGPRVGAVLLHFEGNTSSWKKNLKQWQAKSLCDLILAAGRVPVILDWDGRSPLPNGQTIFCPDAKHPLWGGFGSGDAEVIAALVHHAEAYIGIDSGPGKCASATETPTLICWRDHHPVQFHDPAPNTVHLLPAHWRKIPPAEHSGVATYFEKNYQYLVYEGEHGLVEVARKWLAGKLGCGEAIPERGGTMAYALPQGIGDTLWALTKIRSIARDKPIDIVLAGDNTEIGKRAVPFLKRFKFVRSVEVLDIPLLEGEMDSEKNDALGRYRYLPDGERGGFHYLVPNKVLERGERLETWLPEHPVDWDVMDHFDWSGTEKGRELGRVLAPFAAFYLGPEKGHTDEGHNRGWLWEPKHWVALGKHLTQRGLRVAVVGASYDRSFWERYVREGVGQEGMKWVDLLGALEIGDTLAFIRQAKVFVGYQSGLVMCAHYLGVPTVSWWRPAGDSAHPDRLVSFAEEMKDSWVSPKYKDRYLGCVYKRQTVNDIVAEMESRGWLR